MKEWICSLGPILGTAVGAILIAGIITGFIFLFHWIGKKLEDLPTPDYWPKWIGIPTMVIVCLLLVGTVVLFIYGLITFGHGLWLGICEG